MILSQKPAQSMEKLRLPSKKTVKRSIVPPVIVSEYSNSASWTSITESATSDSKITLCCIFAYG